MPNIAQVLKGEIARISRREIKDSLIRVHDSNVYLRKAVSELKKKIAVLESESKQLLSFQKTVQKQMPQAGPEVVEKVRISSKGIRKLRTKLGLSQNSFASLLGVTSQAVFAMEKKEGRVKLRPATLSNLLQVRKMGKREAKKRIKELGNKK
jgi:DNA-binding transcriptional regulator YiaG